MHEPNDLVWRKSHLCESEGCIEVAAVGDEVWIRNSKIPSKVTIASREDWETFAAGIAGGGFDLAA